MMLVTTRRIVLLVCLAPFAIPALLCHGQENPWWPIPKSTVKVDLGNNGRDCHPVLTNSGLEAEVIVQFALLGATVIPLEANLPEDGHFDVQITTPSDAVEIVNLRTEGHTGKAEIRAKYEIADMARLREMALSVCFKLLEPGINEAHERAKSLTKADFESYLQKRVKKLPEDPSQLLEEYCRAWAVENAVQPVKDHLRALAKERPNWLSESDVDRLQSASGQTLLSRCHQLIAFDLADKCLRSCGVELNAANSNYRTELEPKVNAVYLIMSGKARETPNAGRLIATALSRKDQANLHRNFNIRLSCRFRPNVDPRDGNAQWFDAQRVAARASGALVIRVEGSLNPAKGDCCDWWLLDRYSEATVQLELPRDKGLRIEKYPAEGLLRLRVVALGESAVDYAFQLQATKGSSSGATLIVCESPDSPIPEFPF